MQHLIQNYAIVTLGVKPVQSGKRRGHLLACRLKIKIEASKLTENDQIFKQV